jgi:uncharacterized protein
MASIHLEQLRHHAIARSFFPPTSLERAIHQLGFVQADPIRSPTRAQDLTLRHRVIGYQAGDLERQYASLPIEEDFFLNYGFLPRNTQALMHPRTPGQAWTVERWAQAHAIHAWVIEKGVVSPREVNAHFAQGTAKNWFGGSSSASTQLLDGMHFRGLLRIAKRENGIRHYATRAPTPAATDSSAAFDALVDVAVACYAPLPAVTLGQLLSHLCVGVPQWRGQRIATLQRAKKRLSHAVVEGVDWYWPAGELLLRSEPDDAVRLLTPFDPVVWDRRRFELFWGWAYRFEAYTPAPKRKLGYYAMPLLWRDEVVGWGNLSTEGSSLKAQLGYVKGRAPRDPVFKRELQAELDRMAVFLKPRQ